MKRMHWTQLLTVATCQFLGLLFIHSLILKTRNILKLDVFWHFCFNVTQVSLETKQLSDLVWFVITALPCLPVYKLNLWLIVDI